MHRQYNFFKWIFFSDLIQACLYFDIYAFSRCFYPKRLTIAFRLYIFISTCVPWESNPQPFAQLTQCSTTEPHRNTVSLELCLVWSCDRMFTFPRKLITTTDEEFVTIKNLQHLRKEIQSKCHRRRRAVLIAMQITHIRIVRLAILNKAWE